MEPIVVATKVSENRARATAGLVFVITLLSLVFRSPWPFLFLALDFALRAFARPGVAPLALLSARVVAPLPLISLAPKRFAGVA